MQESMGAQLIQLITQVYPTPLETLMVSNPHVSIKMPTEFGQKFYDETINNPYIQESETFNEFSLGLYVTTTFGSGNILSVASSVLVIYYNWQVVMLLQEKTL